MLSKKELINRDYYEGRVIWITGASSGIGEALAEALAKTGAKLILSARSEDKLKQLSEKLGENCSYIPFDVSDKEANQQAIKEIDNQHGRLDTIILNAGTNAYIDRDNFDSTIFEHIMKTNYMSMIYAIEAALPLLKKSKSPHIVGMSSTAAYRGLPRAEAYGASKAAIKNMLEALRLNLLPTGIHVSIICPGFVKTPLTDLNDFEMPLRISANDAAEIIKNDLARKKHEIHFPKAFSIPIKLLSMMPSTWYTYILKRTVR